MYLHLRVSLSNALRMKVYTVIQLMAFLFCNVTLYAELESQQECRLLFSHIYVCPHMQSYFTTSSWTPRVSYITDTRTEPFGLETEKYLDIFRRK